MIATHHEAPFGDHDIVPASLAFAQVQAGEETGNRARVLALPRLSTILAKPTSAVAPAPLVVQV